MGSLPALSVSILRASLSTPVTSFPLSARQVAETSPTYPVPTTATFTASPQKREPRCYTGDRGCRPACRPVTLPTELPAGLFVLLGDGLSPHLSTVRPSRRLSHGAPAKTSVVRTRRPLGDLARHLEPGRHPDRVRAAGGATGPGPITRRRGRGEEHGIGDSIGPHQEH